MSSQSEHKNVSNEILVYFIYIEYFLFSISKAKIITFKLSR